jgi:hypothetical protein
LSGGVFCAGRTEAAMENFGGKASGPLVYFLQIDSFEASVPES